MREGEGNSMRETWRARRVREATKVRGRQTAIRRANRGSKREGVREGVREGEEFAKAVPGEVRTQS